MKQYPSIPGSHYSKVPFGERCVGFHKYDGSNLRWEWNRKRGWYKFGARHRLFDEKDDQFGLAVPIFKQNLDGIVEKVVLREHPGLQDFIVYTEFFGDESFAGSHAKFDDRKRLVLIDVWIPKKGFIIPKNFVRLFGDFSFAPEVVYEGNFNQQLIDDVRAGKFPVNEGIICKGVDRRGQQWMTKIKTQSYLDRLKSFYGKDWEKYAE